MPFFSEPVDFTVVKDSTMENSPKAKDGLPANVSINFNVLGNPVHLDLSRNQKVEKSKNMYVIRKSVQGIPVMIEETLNTNEVCVQMYRNIT